MVVTFIMLYICRANKAHKTKPNIMTLNQMIESDFITDMINQENRDLAGAGKYLWSVKDVKAMASFITDFNKQ